MLIIRWLKIFAIFMTVVVTTANAGLITLDTIDRGWYKGDGSHFSYIQNTITGPVYGLNYNSWFLFDLSGLSGIYESATLRLELERWVGSSYSGTVSIWDVNSQLSELVANHDPSPTGALIHDDLQTGSHYADGIVGLADLGSIIEFTLSEQAILDINKSTGGLFAVGTHLEGVLQSNYLRWSKSDEIRVHQLVLGEIKVPEPSTLAIFALGMIGLASRRFKKQ